MIALLDRAASIWSGWMWAMTWQATLFILIVWAVDRLIRRWAWPQVCHALWLLVLLKLITPPWLALPTSLTAGLFDHAPAVTTQPAPAAPAPPLPPLPDHVAEQATSAPAPVVVEPGAAPPQVAAPAPTVSASIGWKAMAMLTWFAGVIGLGVVVVARWHGLRHEFMEEDRGDRPEAITRLVAKIAAGMGLHRVPTVVFSNKAASPAVFGPLRPVLILTQDLRGRAADPALRYILLHELAHIKRGDLLVQTLCVALQAIYWFNPLLWIVRRRLQALRELCCDATVAGILKEETPLYRETLLNTAERLLERRAGFGLGLLGLVEEPGTLLARLGRLEKQIWKHPRLRVASVVAAVTIAFLAVFPMAVPSAQGAGDTPETMKAEMIRAYKAVSSYEVISKMTVLDLKTNKRESFPSNQRFAFDRAQNSFLYDYRYKTGNDSRNSPLMIACNGSKLWLRDTRPVWSNDKPIERRKDIILETTVTRPLDYEALVARELMMKSEFSELALLLGRDSIEILDRNLPHGETPLKLTAVEPRADDPLKRPGLRVTGWNEPKGSRAIRVATFWLDPKTHLVSQFMTFVADDDSVASASEAMEIYSDLETVKLNEPVDRELFTVDTKGLKTVSTYDDLYPAPVKTPKKKASSAPEQVTGSGRVSGRVTDYQHRPVANCEVFFLPLGTGSVIRKFLEGGQARTTEAYTYTDAKGEYLSPDLPVGEYRPYFSAPKMGMGSASKHVKVANGATAQVAEQVLFPEVVYSGTVMNETGAPVAGAIVSIVSVPMGEMKNKRYIPAYYLKFKTETDSQGRFTKDRLPPLLEGEQYDVVVEHPAYMVAQQVAVPPDKSNDVKITMKRGCTVHGRVANSAGAPAEGAVISAYQVKPKALFSWDESGLRLYKTGISGKDGSFAIEGLEPGFNYQFIARGNNQVSSLLDANERNVSEREIPPLDLKLLNCAVLEVTVVDVGKKPIPNLKIQFHGNQTFLIENHGTADMRRSTWIDKKTDANGKIRFDGIEDCGAASVSIDQEEGYGRVFKKIGKIEPGKTYQEIFVVDTK